jgi:hypothetical protein
MTPLNGLAMLVGTAPGNVTMTTGTLPAGILATGIVTVAQTRKQAIPLTFVG